MHVPLLILLKIHETDISLMREIGLKINDTQLHYRVILEVSYLLF